MVFYHGTVEGLALLTDPYCQVTIDKFIMIKEITLQKNCVATIIPAGDEITLAEGATFSIAQSLGGSITLRDASGMYRVGQEGLDALGGRSEATGSIDERACKRPRPF